MCSSLNSLSRFRDAQLSARRFRQAVVPNDSTDDTEHRRGVPTTSDDGDEGTAPEQMNRPSRLCATKVDTDEQGSSADGDDAACSRGRIARYRR